MTTNTTEKMELLKETAEIREIAMKASELNIPYQGVAKKKLFELVNAKIEKLNAGEDTVKSTERDENGKIIVPKWYEAEGAFPYKEGDIVEIVSGKDLIGRRLQIVKPSAKKQAAKGHLIHKSSGELQNTLISIDFERIQLVSSKDNEEENQEII